MSTEARIIGMVGPRGAGKSTLMLDACEQLRRLGVVTIVSDPNGDFPREIRTGEHAGQLVSMCVRDSLPRLYWRMLIDMVSPWDRGLSRIYLHDGDDPDGVLETAIALGSKGAPVAAVIDEAGTWDAAANARVLRGELRRVYARARHMGVWVVWGAQWPQLVSGAMYRGADLMVVWGYRDAGDLARLREGGLGDANIDRIRALADHDHIAVQMHQLTTPLALGEILPR